ncbi:MAG: hypothetical protein ACOC1K_04230 [Nanoarchaeota archaeon]
MKKFDDFKEFKETVFEHFNYQEIEMIEFVESTEKHIKPNRAVEYEKKYYVIFWLKDEHGYRYWISNSLINELRANIFSDVVKI